MKRAFPLTPPVVVVVETRLEGPDRELAAEEGDELTGEYMQPINFGTPHGGTWNPPAARWTSEKG